MIGRFFPSNLDPVALRLFFFFVKAIVSDVASQPLRNRSQHNQCFHRGAVAQLGSQVTLAA